MSFGFSAGDIATAIVVIAKIVQALNSVCGVSAEYREAVAFLKNLQRILEPLHTLSALNAYPAYSEEIQTKMCDIKGPIEEFLHAVKKYEPSLGVDAKKGNHRNIPRKLEWHFRMSKDVERLRDKVGTHLLLIDKVLQRLTMDMLWVIQQNTSTENLQRAFYEALGPRLVTAFQDQLEPLRQEMLSIRLNQNEQHAILISELHDQNHHTKLILGMQSGLGESLAIGGSDQVVNSLEALRNAQTESNKFQAAKDKLQELSYAVLLCLGYFLRDIFFALSQLAQPTRALTPTLLAKYNISFYDAIGRPVRILQYDTFISYKVFRAFIKSSFLDTPGSKWVMRGLYQLYNSRNGNELSEKLWPQMVSPGTSIVMSMVLEQFTKATKNEERFCPSLKCPGTLERKYGALWSICNQCEAEVSEVHFSNLDIQSKHSQHDAQRIKSTMKYSVSSPSHTPKISRLQEEKLDPEEIVHFKRITRLRNIGLPCILRNITGCPVTFQVDDRDIWKSHCVSHYGESGPPTHSVCVFCDAVFDPSSFSTPWFDRMDHIAEHFENGWNLDYSRPDCGVATYRRKNFLTKEDDIHDSSEGLLGSLQSRTHKGILKEKGEKDKVNREKRSPGSDIQSPDEKRMRFEGAEEEVTRREGRVWHKNEKLG